MNNSTKQKLKSQKLNDITKYLIQMRLPVMADRLISVYSDPQSHLDSTLDILDMIVYEEYQARRHNTIQRHLR